MERGYWAGRTSFGRRKPVWKRKRSMRKMSAYTSAVVPYRRMGYVGRWGSARLGNFTTTRLVTEFFVTNTVAAGVPGIQGGPTLPCIVLGTTAASTGPGFNIPFAMQFAASQVQNFTELNAIFDHYKINWAKVHITYQHNVSTASGTSTMPTLLWVPDYDDGIPVGPGSLRERAGLEVCEFTSDKRTQVMFLRPRCLGYVFNSATATSVAGDSMTGWIDVAADNTGHFGIKGYLANVELPATGVGPFTSSFRFDVELNISFRGTR